LKFGDGSFTGLTENLRRKPLCHFLRSMFHPSRDFTLARWGFARVLGVVFFCAFASLGWQVRGLAGSEGIAPAQAWLDMVWSQLGAGALWQVPTFCWLGAGDAMLVTLCLLGIAVALVLIWGQWYPGPCALVLWALYLSLCWVIHPFLGFQWDALLLETALLGAVWLPWQARPDWRSGSLRVDVARWLLWWLLFRLMFLSGFVKLASGDPTWSDGTALAFHFETQPLPLWTAWLAHQMPGWMLRIATVVMFAVEFFAPFLIVAPRLWRHGAAWTLIGLQLLIAVTGNYAFFNLLTIGLCLTLFDNRAWPARWQARFASLPASAPPPPPRAPWPRWLRRVGWAAGGALVALVFFLSLPPLLSTFGLVRTWPAPLAFVHQAVAPLRSFNGYGLFAVMTTKRHEIVVEGSQDGTVWLAYEFPWKPGDLNRRPGLVAPHQPRLDWQMWFAALGTVQDNPWFVQFLVRLLEGSPEVVDLLETNPFPDRPPVFIRATLYDYHFTHFGEDQHPGWWKRERLGLYCPAITLQRGQPVVVTEEKTR
jgi:hypothetical protein